MYKLIGLLDLLGGLLLSGAVTLGLPGKHAVRPLARRLDLIVVWTFPVAYLIFMVQILCGVLYLFPVFTYIHHSLGLVNPQFQ